MARKPTKRARDAAHETPKRRRNAEPKGKTTLARLLEMPESTILTGGLHIELHANHEALIEGCSGVLEYSEERIRLTAGDLVLQFIGTDLRLCTMDLHSAVVQGTFLSIEFVS